MSSMEQDDFSIAVVGNQRSPGLGASGPPLPPLFPPTSTVETAEVPINLAHHGIVFFSVLASPSRPGKNERAHAFLSNAQHAGSRAQADFVDSGGVTFREALGYPGLGGLGTHKRRTK